MSLHYILDGYNILKQMPARNFSEFQEEREYLIHLIEATNPQGSRKNSVTVVFDGQPGIAGYLKTSFVKIIFSVNESADAKIKQMVNQAPNKKRIVVITNDREIKFHVRALGAEVKSVEDFLAKMDFHSPSPRKGKFNKKEDKEHKSIPPSLEYQITSELEKIWLSKKMK